MTARIVFPALLLLPVVAALAWAGPPRGGGEDPDRALAERFARLALQCVHREYPNKIAHLMNADADARPPRELTPAFFGCFDWHSSVHGHWLLARLLRRMPDAPFAREARAALDRSLTAVNLAAEVRYLQGPGRVSFERPYGLAWLLQLGSELREWDQEVGRLAPEVNPGARASGAHAPAGLRPRTPDDARRWGAALAPLEREAAARISAWLPKLTNPIRAGEHSQTAFAFGLTLDWARRAGDHALGSLLQDRIRAFYFRDEACPLAYEPSGEDFLSPCLAEADLMRRVLPPAEYASWLERFLPGLPRRAGEAWLPPAVVSDPSDPKLAHLDGLNLSRAWMLEGIASGLPPGDARRAALLAAAVAHRDAGLRAVTGEHYEGGHWLGTFAVYLVTARGLPPPSP